MDVTEKMVVDAENAYVNDMDHGYPRSECIRSALSAALEQEQEAVEHDEVFAQLVLIKQLATDTTDRNWRNKRLYIIQAAARALASPVATRESVVGWLHTLHSEMDQKERQLSFSPNDPFGEAGEAYTCISQPVYLATVSRNDVIRECIEKIEYMGCRLDGMLERNRVLSALSTLLEGGR